MWTETMVENRGLRIAARVYGGSGRDAVLIHGGPGQNLATWDAFAPHLAGDVRATALDMRGNGASDDADDYSYAALASDVRAVIEHFRLTEPVIVGHSWGGQIATFYASAHEDCTGVITVDGWITDVNPHSTEEEWARLAEEYEAEEFFRFVGTEEQVGVAVSEIARLYGASASAVARRQLRQRDDELWAWRRSPAELLRVERLVDEHTRGVGTEIYEGVRCAILLIGGERSERERNEERQGRFGAWGFSRAATAPVVADHANMRDMWLPCGHDVPHELPEALAGEIRRFVESL